MADENEVRVFFERNLPLASKLGGALVGVAFSAATGVPWLGTLASPFFAHNLERVGKELIDRNLAPRQQVRVARAVVVAMDQARRRLDAGEQPRDDEFIAAAGASDRSHAAEVTEAGLMAAMNSSEERKVDFIGSLIAALVFRSDVSPSTAHLLIRLAESTSYCGFLLLRIIGQNTPGHYPSRDTAQGVPHVRGLESLEIEVAELINRGLVTMRDTADASDSYQFSGPESVDPTLLYLTGIGDLLADLAALNDLDWDDPSLQGTLDDLTALARTPSGNSILDGRRF